MTAIEVHEIPVVSSASAFFEWVRGRFMAAQDLPDPDCLLGAGHATHWPMLAARRTYGGRIVVLMRPSLPLGWFDHCIIPEHDNPPVRANVIATKGVLNTMSFSKEKDRSKGVILIGGESRHYAWKDEVLKEQLNRLIARSAEINWWLTTSRRTPASTLEMLRALPFPNLEVVPHSETPKDWVARHMKDSGQVWVTPDSVSMLYESLTACDRVGVLKTSADGGRSRVAAAVDLMIGAGQVSMLDERGAQSLWHDQTQPPLAEADRVAKQLLRLSL